MAVKKDGGEIRLPGREQTESPLGYAPIFCDRDSEPMTDMSGGSAREPYLIGTEEPGQFYRELEDDGFLLDYDTPAL